MALGSNTDRTSSSRPIFVADSPQVWSCATPFAREGVALPAARSVRLKHRLATYGVSAALPGSSVRSKLILLDRLAAEPISHAGAKQNAEAAREYVSKHKLFPEVPGPASGHMIASSSVRREEAERPNFVNYACLGPNTRCVSTTNRGGRSHAHENRDR